MNRDDVLKTAALAAGGLWGWFEGIDPLWQLLVILMAIDFATGVLAGYIRKELSSEVSFRGLAKKAIVLLVVSAATALDGLGGVPIAAAVALAYSLHEALSIVENATKAGLPVPAVLTDALAKFAPPAKERRP